ncbi:pyrophosphate--fructose-6-phosphate 1-phosphotransferase [Vigna unguiculata]|uniref:Pyrophosphate--fructose-6-phosphate 1-phosphotransferase n=1 Tax=Vigna unguiculata TaxID=3917 RepID=A0A4D6MGG8_VIGUN|nr:pyrophosphate--fructose-6-phosphate 1-phosphotransferase [Vigna unguiculata]
MERPENISIVAKIETKKMLIQIVETDLAKRREEGKYKGKFRGHTHFFGIEIYVLQEKNGQSKELHSS